MSRTPIARTMPPGVAHIGTICLAIGRASGRRSGALKWGPVVGALPFATAGPRPEGQRGRTMSDELSAYHAEIRAYEDAWHEAAKDERLSRRDDEDEGPDRGRRGGARKSSARS